MEKKNFPESKFASLQDITYLFLAEKSFADEQSKTAIAEANAAFKLGIFFYGYETLVNSYNSRFK